MCDRRSFLSTSSAGLAMAAGLPQVRARDTKLESGLVRLDSGIEPLVRLIEETGRDDLGDARLDIFLDPAAGDLVVV